MSELAVMKKSNALQIAPNLSLPAESVTNTFAILAVRGAGKSNTGAVMAEEMFHASLPFVAIDPVGSWWGLRSSGDGKSAGLSIPIFGGRHGDVPLERGGGELVADLIVEKRLSCVLDISEFASEGDKKYFLLAFARRLFQKNQDPLHLFLEEADDYLPQKPMRDEAQLLRAWENIVRRGRARGLGMTMITQRSAALNKMVLTQVETLIVMRTTSPQDRAAIELWVKYHAEKADILESLPSLKDGEAWVWSPHFLKLCERVQIRRRATFDSGATPKTKSGVISRPVASMADIDLAAITEKMKETIERAKAEDPRELRKRIAELERRTPNKPDPHALTQEYERGFREGQRALEAQYRAAISKVKFIRELLADIPRKLESGFEELDTLWQQGDLIHTPHNPKVAWPAVPRRSASAEPKAGAGSHRAASQSEVGQGGLRRMLIALAQRPQGLSHKQIGVRAGLSSKSGTFGTYLATARSNGWIEGSRDQIRITPSGVKALGSYERLPEGGELLNYWLAELDAGAARMLQALANAYPKALTAEQVSEAALISSSSGTFGTYLSKLRSLELITGSRNELRASEELF